MKPSSTSIVSYKIEKQVKVNQTENLNSKVLILVCSFAFTQNKIFIAQPIFQNCTFGYQATFEPKSEFQILSFRFGFEVSEI